MNWANYLLLLIATYRIWLSYQIKGRERLGKNNFYIDLMIFTIFVIILFYGGWFK